MHYTEIAIAKPFEGNEACVVFNLSEENDLAKIYLYNRNSKNVLYWTN